MLQQTRVESVIGYFHRFIARFPTPAALAAAPVDEVLSMWAGLGYYARARNLHRAAQQVALRHGGEVPSEPAALAALAGFGRYTTGAVGSIAFGHRLPALDGNVVRVLCRLDRVVDDPKVPAVRERLWQRAAALADDARAGDVNQALMELGATVCTPRSPACLVCSPRCAGRGRRATRRSCRSSRGAPSGRASSGSRRWCATRRGGSGSGGGRRMACSAGCGTCRRSRPRGPIRSRCGRSASKRRARR
ncbi:MAG: hypothetical protein R3F65_11910 [bacterium]